MNEISFSSDIKESCTIINKELNIKETNITLCINGYNNKGTIDIIKKWQSCFALLGKGNLLQSKEASTILYCLLTDACTIENIDGNKVDINLYNPVLNRFYQIESLNQKHRNIRLKVFPICNTVVIFDWQNYPTYKVYELYNTEQVKEYYGSKKVNFDTIVKDINLQPKFTGTVKSLDQLYDDFKILSVDRFVIVDYKERQIKMLQSFMKESQKLEKQIQFEYKNLFFKKEILMNLCNY